MPSTNSECAQKIWGFTSHGRNLAAMFTFVPFIVVNSWPPLPDRPSPAIKFSVSTADGRNESAEVLITPLSQLWKGKQQSAIIAKIYRR